MATKVVLKERNAERAAVVNFLLNFAGRTRAGGQRVVGVDVIEQLAEKITAGVHRSEEEVK